MNEADSVPYCGIAPLPDELWSRWNFDVWLVGALLAIGLLALIRGRKDGPGRIALTSALALMGVVFISPLCALASALFSARVGHHLILIAAVAPLFAIVFPLRRDDDSRATRPFFSLTALTLIQTIIVWLWHVPGPYRFALSSDAAYWLMQSSLVMCAFFFWRRVLCRQTSRGSAVLALSATVMQMGLLGALLVFAPRAVFAPHFGTTHPFGLTELQDQQLAGLLMWVPAMLPYLGMALALSASLLRQADAETAR